MSGRRLAYEHLGIHNYDGVPTQKPASFPCLEVNEQDEFEGRTLQQLIEHTVESLRKLASAMHAKSTKEATQR